MSAIVMVPLILAVGAAIDYSKITSDVQKAQAAADTAVLAASRHYYETFDKNDSRSAGELLADLNSEGDSSSDSHSIETRLERMANGDYEVVVEISGETKNNFMGIVGRPVSPWTVTSVSGVSQPPQIEIILVLDISHSMLTNNKIGRMKSAVETFVKDVSPYKKGESHITISVIPFGGHVNLGAGASDWLSPTEGLDVSDKFYGCFQNIGNTTPPIGDLIAYPQALSHYDSTHNLTAPVCPDDDSDVFLFSRKTDDLIAHIQGLGVSLGTDTPQGLMWANRFLDNHWREDARGFAEDAPIYIDGDTEKVVVLLTDGQPGLWDPNQNGVRDGLTIGPEAINLFEEECEALKSISDMNLFTIGYDVPSDGFSALENCVSGYGQYFDASLNNLENAFSAIKEGLKPIRLTR